MEPVWKNWSIEDPYCAGAGVLISSRRRLGRRGGRQEPGHHQVSNVLIDKEIKTDIFWYIMFWRTFRSSLQPELQCSPNIFGSVQIFSKYFLMSAAWATMTGRSWWRPWTSRRRPSCTTRSWGGPSAASSSRRQGLHRIVISIQYCLYGGNTFFQTNLRLDLLYEVNSNQDKFALLWGEAQLCLPYVCW